MRKIQSVEYLSGYHIRLTFDDGVIGEIDIEKQLSFDGVFAQFRDISFFRRVRVNKAWGTIEWTGKIDLDPEVLYEEITGYIVEWAGRATKREMA